MKSKIDLEKELKRCGKSVYVTYFEFWDNPNFEERVVRTKMKEVKKDESGIKICIYAARRIAERVFSSKR